MSHHVNFELTVRACIVVTKPTFVRANVYTHTHTLHRDLANVCNLQLPVFSFLGACALSAAAPAMVAVSVIIITIIIILVDGKLENFHRSSFSMTQLRTMLSDFSSKYDA